MEEAKASWNTMYQSPESFECQVTLRDEDEVKLTERAKKVMTTITKSGGLPMKRRGYVPDENGGNGHTEAAEQEAGAKPEKTYVDDKGVRRCNLKLNDGKVCRSPVTERNGRYGPFWSCPDYKEHAA